MLNNIVRQQTLTSVANQLSIQQTVGGHAGLPFTNTEENLMRDIFGQDKLKLKATEAARYFGCENCGRKIAGGRYAQHMAKCLDRRRK